MSNFTLEHKRKADTMEKFKRIFLVVLDSVGIGEAPDAEKYDDIGADTLGNIATFMGGLELPNLEKLGLGNIVTFMGGLELQNREKLGIENIKDATGVQKVKAPLAFHTKMIEASAG